MSIDIPSLSEAHNDQDETVRLPPDIVLYLVRHGCTDYNADGRVHGQMDVPLNEVGRAQVAATARYLDDVHFDRACCSILSRAVETAEIILRDQIDPSEIQKDGLLVDRGFGGLEGVKPQDQPYPPDAEPAEAVDGRVREWLNLLLAIHTPYNPRVPTQQSFSSFERLGAGGDPTVRRSKKDQSFLVVTHRDTLNALLRLLTSEESPVQVDIADGVSAGSACGNAGVCRVRLGWDWNPERGLNSRRCVGVIESWGEDAQMS